MHNYSLNILYISNHHHEFYGSCSKCLLLRFVVGEGSSIVVGFERVATHDYYYTLVADSDVADDNYYYNDCFDKFDYFLRMNNFVDIYYYYYDFDFVLKYNHIDYDYDDIAPSLIQLNNFADDTAVVDNYSLNIYVVALLSLKMKRILFYFINRIKKKIE